MTGEVTMQIAARRWAVLTLLVLVSPFVLAAGDGAPSWPELSPPPGAEGGGENDSAVVIGIENYAFVDDIPGAVQNANDWYSWLTRTRKVPLGKVALLRDNDGTKEGILSAVRDTVGKARSGGTLWLVFIGHGAPSKDGADGLLLGVDTMQTADSVYARGLLQAELLDVLNEGPQERTIVVLDACFSGKSSFGDALVEGLQPLVPRYSMEPVDITVLSAGEADQFAGPLPGVARPAFSYLLLGGLRGWADADGDRQVTPSEAVTYAQDAMYALPLGRTQTPQLHGPSGDVAISLGHENGPDLTSMVLALGTSIGSGSAGATVSTGTSVDFQHQLADLDAKKRERERLEREEAELERQIAEDRCQRRESAEASLQHQAQQDWLALAPFLATEGPEARAAAELYVEKYGEASVTVDGETSMVQIDREGDARQWLERFASVEASVSPGLGSDGTEQRGHEMATVEVEENRLECGASGEGPPVGETTPEDWFMLGEMALGSGNCGGAIPHLQMAVCMDPSNANFNYKLGLARHQCGRASEAVGPLERAKIIPAARKLLEEIEMTESDSSGHDLVGGTKASARGTVDMLGVEEVLRSVAPAARACYSRCREDKPDLEGTMILKITLATSGHISSVSLDETSSSLVDTDLMRCVERQIKSKAFPVPHGGTVTFSYPFRFNP
jgi:hypothetical protein